MYDLSYARKIDNKTLCAFADPSLTMSLKGRFLADWFMSKANDMYFEQGLQVMYSDGKIAELDNWMKELSIEIDGICLFLRDQPGTPAHYMRIGKTLKTLIDLCTLRKTGNFSVSITKNLPNILDDYIVGTLLENQSTIEGIYSSGLIDLGSHYQDLLGISNDGYINLRDFLQPKTPLGDIQKELFSTIYDPIDLDFGIGFYGA